MKEPIVIIGAPRSGTNMLRDALAALPGVGTWPCDEINYIWRHGNATYPSDEFPVALARPGVVRYIRAKFEALSKVQGVARVVEKTCANTLRVRFVEAVLPDAKFVHIRRNGVDAVASAAKRWTASLDWPYLLRKARYVPVSDVPYYALRYAGLRMRRLVSSERRLSYWGPRLDGMLEITRDHTLLEICAMQWKRCVDLADAAFSGIEPARVFEIRYEDLVSNPIPKLQGIAEFLELRATPDKLEPIAERISVASVGKGTKELELSALDSEVLPILQDTLARCGYS